MKTATLILCTMLMLCTGCASLHQVGANDNESWLPEAQKDLLNKDATVITWEGTAHDGKVIQFNRDSLVLQEDDSNTALTLPLNRVSTIRPSRNVFPAIGGFLGGFIMGGMIGAGVGSKEPVEKQGQDFLGIGQGLQRIGNTANGAMIGAAVGSVSLSMILGLATSVTDYQFPSSTVHKAQRSSKKPSPNPGGHSI